MLCFKAWAFVVDFFLRDALVTVYLIVAFDV